MAGKRIGIVGQHNDADVQELKAKIEDRGGEARIIDLSLFPSVARGSIGIDEIIFDDMKLLDFDAFYLRRLASIWGLPLEVTLFCPAGKPEEIERNGVGIPFKWNPENGLARLSVERLEKESYLVKL